MGWEFDTNDFDPETIGGFDNPKPGRYHVQVQNVDENGGKNGEMTVRFMVLAGTTPNQEGKTHLEYFSKSAKAAKRALQFAVAVGLTTIAELKTCKAAGKNPVIHFNDAVGRQLCIGLEEDEYEGKKRVKVDFRIWGIGDPEADGIPLNQGVLAKNGEMAAAADPFADPFGDAF